MQDVIKLGMLIKSEPKPHSSLAAKSRPRRMFVAPICFLLLFPLVGCPGPQLVHYDETTYQHLTFVKPEILALYDTFKIDPVNDSKISDIDLKIVQIREYEAGKGAGNVDMTHQVDLI